MITFSYAGINLFAFCSSCVKMASGNFPGETKTERLAGFVTHCLTTLRRQQMTEFPSKFSIITADASRLSTSEGYSRQTSDEDRLPSAEGNRPRQRSAGFWPSLLDEQYGDRSFFPRHRQHKTVFSFLQGLPR